MVRVKLGRKAQLDEAKCRQDRERGGRAEGGGKIKPDSEEDADGRRYPDGCSSRQAANSQPLLEDHTSTEKADSSHDALRHSRRVGPDGIEWNNGHPLILVDGHQHQQGRRDADERVRAESRWTSVEGALEPDECADHDSGEHPDQDHQFLGSDRYGDVLSRSATALSALSAFLFGGLWHATRGQRCSR